MEKNRYNTFVHMGGSNKVAFKLPLFLYLQNQLLDNDIFSNVENKQLFYLINTIINEYRLPDKPGACPQ